MGQAELPAGVARIGKQAFGSIAGLRLYIVAAERELANYPWELNETSVTWEGEGRKPVNSRGAFVLEEGAETAGNRKALLLPTSLRVISAHSLLPYTALRSIEVAPENPWYSAINGASYNKAVTRMVCRPQGYDFDEFAIPNTVTVIDAARFSGAKD